jgi:hypothetical protein
MLRRFLFAIVAVLAIADVVAAADATLLRLFLTDGTSLVSFGEYARVGDRVIFSMPAGGPVEQPRLQVVTIPAAAVDWTRTDRYATSARYQQYAETRGEADFAQLTNDVARVLNDIALTTDRSRALALAEQARKSLLEWPRTHLGYRQQDVREIATLIDESISDLRAALGVSSFDLSLVASPAAAPLEPLLGMPPVREQLNQILRVATLAERTSERVALLQTALQMLIEAGPAIPTADAARLRASTERMLREEDLIDTRYRAMTERLLAVASRAAARARVDDVQRVLNQIAREDTKLGARRPEAIDALRASVQGQLEAARQLRLLRDRWLIRRSLYRDYQRTVGALLLQLVKTQPALESIRRLDGPPPQVVVSTRARMNGGAERLSRLHLPDDLRGVHELIISAWRFAENALNRRYDAIQSGNVATAREASSAAAGSLMLLSRAQEELRLLVEPPQLR